MDAIKAIQRTLTTKKIYSAQEDYFWVDDETKERVETANPLFYTNKSLHEILDPKRQFFWGSRINSRLSPSENSDIPTNTPILEFDEKGNLKTSVNEPQESSLKTLYANITVFDISNIDAIGESFEIYFRLSLLYDIPNFINDVPLKLSYSTEELIPKIALPSVFVFNELERLDTKEDEELILRRATDGAGAFLVQWSKSFRMKCRERMELGDFPFDLQRLTLDLHLDSTEVSQSYHMKVGVVQFHQQAVELSEWEMYPPSIRPFGKRVVEVRLKARRLYMFYVQNIAGMMFMLSLLGLLTFQMDIGDIGSRVGTVLTLILTAVAFKFVLSESLPKVPYNTMMDYYIMFSMASLAIMSLISIGPAYISEEEPERRTNLNRILGGSAATIIVGATGAWLCWAKIRFQRSLHAGEKKISLLKKRGGDCDVLKPIKRLKQASQEPWNQSRSPTLRNINVGKDQQSGSTSTLKERLYSYIYCNDPLFVRHKASMVQMRPKSRSVVGANITDRSPTDSKELLTNNSSSTTQ